nr:TetR-like C-terminal domain-containing protein [Streptomyces sp. CoH27]
MGPGQPAGLPADLRRPRPRLPGPRRRSRTGRRPPGLHRTHRARRSRLAPGRTPVRGRRLHLVRLDAGLLDKVRPAFPELPPAAVALALRIWGHLHGLVSLEIYGHLHTQTKRPDKLFQQELAQLVRNLGVPHR